ncbi:MAG: hypothetical protein RI932_226 [Pseudomonadota bacterium]|jgi:hypothetical protein
MRAPHSLKLFGLCKLQFLPLALISNIAEAGSITGDVGSSYQDPCAHPTGTAGTCSAALSAQYLERCLANFEGLTPSARWNPDACNSGHCQGWKLTARSKVLVTDQRPTQFAAAYQAQYCTDKRLYIMDAIPGPSSRLAVQVCQNGAGQVSALKQTGAAIVKSIVMNPPNINAIQLPSYQETVPIPATRKITHRRVYMRAADPDGVFTVPGGSPPQKYLYSLSLKDAICTWRKFCNPTARGLKAGVSTAGEALLPGATSFEPDHPIARLCQLDPKWHMSNAAVSCAISQSGGIDMLCSTPDPLHKNPPVGIP